MAKDLKSNGPASKLKRALIIFEVIPLFFTSVVLIGLITGLLLINANDYLHYGMTRLALLSVVRQMNLFLLFCARNFFLVVLFWIGFCILFRFDRQKAATAMAGTLLIGLLAATIGYGIGAKSLLLAPVTRPLKALVLLVIGLAIGVAFQKLFGARLSGLFSRITGKKAMVLIWSLFTLALVLFPSLNAASRIIGGKKGLPTPNVILISIDGLRQDALGAYGSEFGSTPIMDKLAQSGAVFENAYTNSPWPLPALASLMTGMPPYALGIDKIDDTLSPKALTLAEILNNYGYTTGVITCGPFTNLQYGLDQGFMGIIHNDRQTAKDVLAYASAFLQKNLNKKFFLFIQISDLNWPYRLASDSIEKLSETPPTNKQIVLQREDNFLVWATRNIKGGQEAQNFSRLIYQTKVSEVDNALENFFGFFAGTNITERTVVIVTSTNGALFGEHELMGTGHSLYQGAVKVPLFVRFPAMIQEQSRVALPVSTDDLLPTILSMVSIENPNSELTGNDIASDIYLKEGAEEEPVILETALAGDKYFGILQGRYKYIQPHLLSFGGRIENRFGVELYDLETDPDEDNNLADTMPEIVRNLEKLLTEKVAGRNGLSFSKKKRLSQDQLRTLESSGLYFPDQ